MHVNEWTLLVAVSIFIKYNSCSHFDYDNSHIHASPSITFFYFITQRMIPSHIAIATSIQLTICFNLFLKKYSCILYM